MLPRERFGPTELLRWLEDTQDSNERAKRSHAKRRAAMRASKMPRITRPQVYRVVREMLPRERFGPTELLRWLEDTQDSNERAKRSHAKRRAAMRASPHIPP